MRILLDCRPLQSAGPEADKTRLILAAAAELSAAGVEWVVVADHRYRPGLIPGLPGKVVIRRAFPGTVGWRLWYDRQIRRVAKQEGVDRVWLTGGIIGEMTAPASRYLQPLACLWMPERADPRERDGRRGYSTLYRSRLELSLQRAAEIVCYSERDRIWLEGIGSQGKGKIRVLTAVGDETIVPLSPEEKEAIKAKKASGTEYFLADLTGCGEDAVVELLKAFSIFKKRQQSHMRLILTGRITASQRIGERLKTYKYRQDVDWAEGAPDAESRTLTGAAYAVLLPVEGNSLGTTLLNTWKAGIPVIAAGGGLLEEMAQGAALSMVPGDAASLAGQLMRIYKEEHLRGELTRKGFERLKVYSRENFLQVLRVITEIAVC